jgi:hypothetical protein
MPAKQNKVANKTANRFIGILLAEWSQPVNHPEPPIAISASAWDFSAKASEIIAEFIRSQERSATTFVQAFS